MISTQMKNWSKTKINLFYFLYVVKEKMIKHCISAEKNCQKLYTFLNTSPEVKMYVFIYFMSERIISVK